MKQIDATPRSGADSRVLHWLLLGSFVPWLCITMVTFFIVSAEGAYENAAIWRVVVPIWCYPFLVLACVVAAFALRRMQLRRGARFALATPLILAAVAVLWFAVWIGAILL